MGGIFSFPDQNEIATTLSTLLNKEVSVTSGATITTSPKIAGTYIDQQQTLGALVVVDLPMASYSGAALTMIPCGVVTSTMKAGKLSDEVGENLQEVFNVMVAFFNKGSVPHIRYSDLHIASPAFPVEIDALISSKVQYADLNVDISGYGAGQMSLYAL